MRSVRGGSKKTRALVAQTVRVANDRTVSRTAGPHDMIVYIQSLDIDPVREPEIIWIAEEAFQAQLPPGWSEHVEESGLSYFHNAVLGESSWTHPMDELFKEIAQYQRQVQSVGGFWLVDDELADLEESTRERLAEWTELYDEHNEKFYFNRNTQETRLEDPRALWYHNLYTRIRMVERIRERLPHLAQVPRPMEPEEVERLRQLREQQEMYILMVVRIQCMFRVQLAKARAHRLRDRAKLGDPSSPIRQNLRLEVRHGDRDLVLKTTREADMHKAATKIQARIRGVLARTHFRRILLQKAHKDIMATMIQRQARKWLARLAREREERRCREAAALSMQAARRGVMSRRRANGMRKERDCATRIQGAVRAQQARKLVKQKRYEHRWHFGRLVQRSCHTLVARLHVRRLQLLEEPVQLCVRLSTDPKEAGVRPWTIGLIMSSTWERKPMGDLAPVDLFERVGNGVPLQDYAATVIQRHARAMIQRPIFKKQLEEARRVAYELSQRRDVIEFCGACRVQKHLRGFLARKQDEMGRRRHAFYASQVEVIKELQLQFVKFVAQYDHQAEVVAHTRRGAAVRIQALARGHLARKQVRRLEEERLWPIKLWFDYEPTGPGTCQTFVRVLPNPRFDDFYHWALTDRVEEDSLANCLARMQEEVGTCVDKYLEVALAEAKLKAATKIQAHARGKWARDEKKRLLEEKLEVDRRKAATRIQARYRGKLVRNERKRQGEDKLEAERSKAATKIQARFRGKLVRNERKRMLEEKVEVTMLPETLPKARTKSHNSVKISARDSEGGRSAMDVDLGEDVGRSAFAGSRTASRVSDTLGMGDEASEEEDLDLIPEDASPSAMENRRHYAGVMRNGRFYRTKKADLNQMTQEEKQAILDDLANDRRKKVEELARRQRQRAEKQMRQKMKEVKKFRSTMGGFPMGHQPKCLVHSHVHHHAHRSMFDGASRSDTFAHRGDAALPPLRHPSFSKLAPGDADFTGLPPEMRRTASAAEFRTVQATPTHSKQSLAYSASAGRLSPGRTQQAPWAALPSLYAA